MSRPSDELESDPRPGNRPQQRETPLLPFENPLTCHRNRVSNSHVKMLEEKLDGLVSLLKSVHEIGSADEVSLASTVPSAGLVDQDVRLSSLPSEDLNRSNHALCTSVSHQGGPSSAPQLQDPCARTFNGPEWRPSSHPPTAEEAETLLEIYRNESSFFFPFISIPQSTRANELRREKPFTYLAIMAVSSTKCPQQRELSRIIIRQVAERVFVDGERNIDLLLGILTFAGFVP